MKKKDQSSGSAKTNQPTKITFPETGFPEKNLATKYWWTASKEDYPRRIINRTIKNGEDIPVCMDSSLAALVLKVQYLETLSLLYQQYGDQVAGKRLLSTAQMKCLDELMESFGQSDADGLTKNFIEGYGEGFVPVKNLFDLKDDVGNFLKCITKPHIVKGVEIQQAQTKYKFFEQHYEDIFYNEKSGAELLKEAEDHLDQVCDGFVPRRLKKQVRDSKNKGESPE